MNDFIDALSSEFQKNSNAEIAASQKSYLRNLFDAYGIKTPKRREIQKPFLVKSYLPEKAIAEKIIRELWRKPQREYHYFAQELALKYIKEVEEADIELFEYLLTHNSWWDTVDFIAPKLIGEYFKKFPHQRDIYLKKWLVSKHIWLQRAAILFQLKHKENIDTICLSYVITHLLGSTEFFINKAIGWILREYSRTNPEWVIDFVGKTDLAELSRREALRLLKN